MKLTTLLHLLPKLRINGATPLLPHTALWCVESPHRALPFFFGCRYFKIPKNNLIWNVPLSSQGSGTVINKPD
jgi:hypothetical protein